ncbi:hypothetical protein [Mobiluncus mulieris]|nr:hypothetical protein [Mobiluncus mulieris]EEJ53013.1 hypothetical protein HMPREF0577_2024 [Mobiluncus mulieris ATCC 35243]
MTPVWRAAEAENQAQIIFLWIKGVLARLWKTEKTTIWPRKTSVFRTCLAQT